jgi:peptidoglycan/xylan/chitin deacetylase (PgdA/CDA1 family)
MGKLSFAGVALLIAAVLVVPQFRHGGRGQAPARRAVHSAARGVDRRTSRTHMVTGAAARRVRVPILMYHVIADPPPGEPYPELWVSPRAFRAQVRALVAAHYHGVTLSRVFAAWRHGDPLPSKPVVLSFDDGYRSQAVVAARALRAVGWPGVLDLAIRNAGSDNGLRVARLRRLIRDGWEIASHTVDHADLTTLDATAVRHELVRSRDWIRRRLGVPAAFFCYPAGRFDAAVVAAVRAAGYRGATTEIPGVARAGDDPYELPRVRVMRGETAAQLLAAVSAHER